MSCMYLAVHVLLTCSIAGVFLESSVVMFLLRNILLESSVVVYASVLYCQTVQHQTVEALVSSIVAMEIPR